MKQSLVKNDIDEILEPSNELVELMEMVEQIAVRRQPTYHPTSWTIVNRIWDIVDNVTNGRAGVLQKVFSYLFFGGTAALVNLAVFFIVFYLLPLPVRLFTHNAIALVLASEISIMANFIPNDYFTFRHMPGRAQSSWRARCTRFHITSLSGTLLTIVLQLFFSSVLHIIPIVGQAMALILALFYNYTVHNLFTYRHKKPAPGAN